MYIKIKAFPNAKKNQIVQKAPDQFQIYVKEKPIGSRANEAISQLLAEYFKLPVNQIRLVKGRKTPNKLFEILDELLVTCRS